MTTAAGRIRAYVAEDLEAVIDVWLQATIAGQAFLPEAHWRAMEPDILSLLPEAEVWVTEQHGEVVAFASLLDNLLGGLFTHPDHQGSGHGAALVAHCRTRRSPLDVEVFAANERARAFYERCGFRPVDDYPDPESGLTLLRLRLAG